MPGRCVPDGYIKEKAPHGFPWGAFSVLRHFRVFSPPYMGVFFRSALENFSDFSGSARTFQSEGYGMVLRISGHILDLRVHCSAFAQLVGFLQVR